MKTNINQFSDDIQERFVKIKNSLNIHLYSDSDIQWKKKFFSNNVPKEVMNASEILMDTVMNALMIEARSHLKNASIELQNKFFDYDFRKRLKESSLQIENKLSVETEFIKYSKDPQLLHGLVSASVAFIVGAGITGFVFIPHMFWSAVVSGIVTLILSAASFKFAYDRAEPQAIDAMVADVNVYLENSKSHIEKWLEMMITTFDSEFKSFCTNNGWEVK